MEIISEFNTKPYIAHFPGKSYNIHESFIKEHLENHTITDKITVICIATRKLLSSYTIQQLNNSNIKFINPASEEKQYDWYNAKKIPLIINALENIATDYTLILDSRDVLILRDIDDEFINLFNTNFDKDIVYNATINFFPQIGSLVTDNDHLRFSNKAYRYLNAGVCFGKTSKLLEFYTECNNLLTLESEFKESEQFYIQKTYQSNYPKFSIGIDKNSWLFTYIPVARGLETHKLDSIGIRICDDGLYYKVPIEKNKIDDAINIKVDED